MYLFYAMHQNRRISQAQGEASSAKNKAQDVIEYVKSVEERFEHLALKCQAMWELIRDNTALTDEDVENKIAEVDLRDGVVDGKMTKVAQSCESCGRNVSTRHSNCLYCGQVLPPKEIFDQ